jgi:proliferating cell nuclear antigen
MITPVKHASEAAATAAAAEAAAAEAAAEPATTPRRLVFIKSIQGGAIRTLFEVLKEIVHDVNLQFDSTGIKLLTMDGARCALVYLRLRADAFEDFSCQGKFNVGVNMGSVFKLVRTCGSHDTITLYIEADNTNELGITISNHDKNSVTDFKLKLLDVDSEDINIPDVEFDSIVTMPSAYFQRLCRDMLQISDNMTIRSEGERLWLSCNGDFARQETVIGPADAGMSLSAKSEKRIEGTFSLKYLSLFCKAANLANTTEMFLKESYPIIIKYNVASLGEIRFCLAPKIDD